MSEQTYIERIREFAKAVESGVKDDDGFYFCAKCQESVTLDENCDPTPLCHPCAQEAVELLPGLMEEIDRIVAEDVAKATAELGAENERLQRLSDRYEEYFRMDTD
jgi:hypothetical protein